MAYLKPDHKGIVFLPLGGCGEIGMNLNLYGSNGRWLMVDLGMTFGDASTPGVDLMFPDISFIEEERERLTALVVTHGHEDHIGAIPYLWQRIRCPIYATAFTGELIRGKLAEAGILDQVPLHIVGSHQELDISPFKVTYVPLAHSIAEGHGLLIETDAGRLFHTGDWKVDDGPLIGPDCPSDKLTEIGDRGVMALVGDSTNVFNASSSGSELDVQKSLVEIVKGIEGRVFITTFASNVARLETIGAIAKATGRSLVLLGRSMNRVVQAAKDTGYLQDYPHIFGEEDLKDLPDNNVLIALTGCQGEHRAALPRIARDGHRLIKLKQSDTVIFSSKIIPGNDIELASLFNALVRKDVNVITEKDAFVHVSGHPGREELAKMFSWVRPNAVIPVHGEDRHIKRHAEFAVEQGIKHTIRPHNGDVVEITSSGVKKIDEIATGRLILDGDTVLPYQANSLVERRRMANQGLVVIHLAFDDDDALMDEPLLSINGIPLGDSNGLYDGLIDAVEDAMEKLGQKGRADDGAIEQAGRIAIRRYLRSEVGKNPSVDVLITRASDLSVASDLRI